MKVGKRMPANVADVTAIAKAMMLNPSETAELLRAYHISHMGEENYFRREHVSKIISSFYDMNSADELVIPTGVQDMLEMNEALKIINGQGNINRILKAVLEIEANKKSGLNINIFLIVLLPLILTATIRLWKQLSFLIKTKDIKAQPTI